MRQPKQAINECPTLHPSEKQFQNFLEFVEATKQKYQQSFGMVKICPPNGWKPRLTLYEMSLKNLVIKNPLQQNPEGKMGAYEFKHMPLPSVTYQDFIKQNQEKQYIIQGKTSNEIQNIFWKTLAFSAPVYGADLVGSLMEDSAQQWHLNNLDSILREGLQKNLKGVNSSYCYIGSWKALFCWHKQDLDLDAINYLHFGKSKFWYCIHPDDSYILENEAKKIFYKGFETCPEYLRHKTCLINPYNLKKKYPNLRLYKMQQKAGEFILAFSGAYHCGFNFGINVAEAVNFATLNWLSKLKNVHYCQCKKSTVRISLQVFLSNLLLRQKYQNNQLLLRLKKENEQKMLSQTNQIQKVDKRNQRNQNNKFKTKYISKDKKTKKQKDVYKNTQQYLCNQNLITWIQCDLCGNWQALNKNNNFFATRQNFCCQDLGKKCKIVKTVQNQNKLQN